PGGARRPRRAGGLAGGAAPLPTLRRPGTLPSNGTQASTTSVLGVPAGGLRLIHRWRAGDANASLATIARRLREPDLRARLPELPAGTKTVELQATRRGDDVALSLLLATPGGVRSVPLQPASGGVLRARLP